MPTGFDGQTTMQHAPLTDDMREYLRAQVRTNILLYDFLLAFMARFHLDGTQAGKILAEWLNETC